MLKVVSPDLYQNEIKILTPGNSNKCQSLQIYNPVLDGYETQSSLTNFVGL
jgi:hypothetical protein